jgi:hypothetical protein
MQKKMRYKTKILLFIAALLTQMSYAADEIVVRKGANTITIKPDTAGTCRVTSIERYERYFLLHHQNDYYLISQSFEVGEGCFEGHNPAKVSVKANSADVRTGKVSKETIWSFSTKGISGERDDELIDNIYRVRYPGCCGATDTFKYFSLNTGNFIGASYCKPLSLEVRVESSKTRKTRYVFMQDNRASEYKGKSGQIALFYSDGERLRQQLAINIAGAPDCLYECETCFKKKESGSDGVSIVLKLNCENSPETTIEIPVISDKLAVEKADIKGSLSIKIQDVTEGNSSSKP